MNILIVKLSAVGDVIHTLPALAALRRHYPSAHITWVVEEAAADLITGHPCLDRVIVSRRKSWIRDVRNGRIERPIAGIRSFYAELRSRPYDLVIDFQGLLKSAVVVMLSGGNRKLGYDSLQELSRLFYDEKIPEDMRKHAVDRYLDFLRHLGAEAGDPEFFVPIQQESESRIDGLLAANGFDRDEPFVAVSPVALWETKLWEDEKFARLCDRIERDLKARVVLTAAQAERIEPILEKMKTSAVNLGGKTTLKDLAELYRRAALLITTDSGPMHLAAAMGTPVVALFGPTDPSRTGPYGESHTTIRKGTSCSPCLLKKCKTRECMYAIAVHDVFAAAKAKMDRLRKG